MVEREMPKRLQRSRQKGARMPEAVEADFLRVPLADGGEWVLLNRLTDGRVACCVCFEFCHRHELEPVASEPSRVWDVCRECAESGGVDLA